jgi:beta-lactamase regulating signal transducer with metallopeptidase domain
MISIILDHLWQSSLLAAAIAILAVLFHKARASVRYALWFTASVKFLVPFAVLTALGRLLAPAIRPPVQAAPDAVFIARAAEPFSVTPHASMPLDPAVLFMGVWALGVAIVLIVWTIRGARIRPLLRMATPAPLAAPMPVMTTPTMMEPGLVGLWRPVLLIPETLLDHLDRAGIEALIAHEACHYRRRDNLTAAVHMLVEALFWFHPLVWWIGGRLVEERERACDEAVVGSGHDPAVYARGLLECCRLFLQSPLRCVAGASGSNLSRRVEMIMTSIPRPSLSRRGKTLLAAAGLCALASPVVAGWLTSPPERQVAAHAVALASRPASTLADTAPAVESAPDSGEPVKTVRAALRDTVPAAAVQQIAAIRPEPLLIDSGAEDRPSPGLAEPLTPVANTGLPDAQLTPVADIRTSDATDALGPGHYEEVSKTHVFQAGGWSPWYTVSTRPIAPGHTISNFHYESRGGFLCDNRIATCRITTNNTFRKVIQFRLFVNNSDCFYQGSVGRLFCNGPATHAQMALIYDVR